MKTHDACQAEESKLAISLSNGVTAGLCWPLNCLWWRKQLLVATLVWHCLLAARLFSASRSHFRLKSPFWQRRTLNAGDWSICCKIQGGHCLHTSCDSAGVPALSEVLGFVLEGPPPPPQPPFLSVSVWCAISAQRVLAGAANASYFQSSNQLRFFFNHLRNFKETSSHPEKMSNVFALLISSTQRTSSVNLSVLEPKISTGAQRGISVRIYCRQYFLKQG